MTAPQRRPRDKGGTDHRDAAAKSFESSNQTMAMFLGATQKSWMTGQHPTREIPPSSTHTHPNPKQTHQTTTSHARASGPRLQVADEGWEAASRQDSVTIATPGSAAATKATFPTLAEKNAQENFNTVLPSPAPSDEPRQASVHIIDLEDEDPAQLANQLTRSISTEALDVPTPIEPAARPGDVDERERRPSNAEVRNGLPDSTNNVRILPALEAAPSLMSNTLAEQHQAQSSNRTHQVLLPSQILPRSALPAPMDRGPNILPVQTPSTADVVAFRTQIPSTADVVAFRTQIVRRLDVIQKTGPLGRDVEISRLGILEDACLAYDLSYLIVHQLYCSAAIQNSANSSGIHALAPEYREGLVLLTDLLLKNNQLSNDAITWFSTFPIPLEALLRRWPGLKFTFDKVLECLLKLPRQWEILSSQCHHRYYPPLVDEMIVMLGVNSTMLQRVMCKAVVREIWVGPQDDCYDEVEMLLRQNQQAVGLRASLTGAQSANAPDIQSYNQRMAMKYQHVWARHRSHLPPGVQQDLVSQQGSMQNVVVPMPPAHQMRADPPIANNATAHHNMSQPVRPAPTSRRPVPLVIDTQSLSTNRTYFVSAPTIPSSPFSGVPIQASPVTTAAASPSFQNLPPGAVLRPHTAIPHSRRRMSRQNFTVPAVSNISGSRSIVGNRNNTHRPQNSVPSQVAANPQPQSFFGRQREPQSGYTISSQPYVASPVTARFGPAGIPFPTSHNVTQQSGTYIPLQSYGQVRSASNPSTPYHTQHTQLVAQQPPTVAHVTSVPASPVWPFFPPSGHVRSFRDPPNAVPATLHQVHVRSPNLTSVNTDGTPDDTPYFAFVRNVALMPERLTNKYRHSRWVFEVDAGHFQSLAKCSDAQCGAPPARIFHAGSRTVRVRCVKISHLQDIHESDWVLAETFWPNGVAILLNTTALEIRKKALHGKDLPVDVTKHIRPGTNMISVAITRPNESDAVIYAFGIEFIEITDSQNVHAMIPSLGANDAQRRIAERSASLDPEIEIVNSAVTIDLTDPFTSCMWEMPVRGKNCRHNQCFDLNVFLQTRGSKTGHPSAPEQFKCPICGSDARPQMLTMDMFFVKIREELQQIGRLDAKAVILDGQGNWRIKEEDQKKDLGDGAGGPMLPGHQPSEISGGQESEIIELDDD